MSLLYSKPAKLALAGVILALMAGVAVAAAGAAPVASKFVFSRDLGWEVNKITGGDVCTAAAVAKGECQAAKESEEPGGFSYPQGIVVQNDPTSPDYGDVYVADRGNHRVQVLSATGAFVSMFGDEVNETTNGDVCTEEEIEATGVKCKAGVEGSAAGQFGEIGPGSMAVDPASGDLYVAERDTGQNAKGEVTFGFRVQEFTAEGKFVLEIGREVNETTKQNLCTAEEVEKAGVKCTGPAPSVSGSTEQGAFNLEDFAANLLAVGGPEDLLYVGDEHRVQEFKTDGEWKGEISLNSISAAPEDKVQALAVAETGEVYLTYGHGETTVVQELNPNGTQSGKFEVTPKEPNPDRYFFGIATLALDPYGRLAVIAREEIIKQVSGGGTSEAEITSRAVLYSSSGASISEFGPPSGKMAGGKLGLAFAASSDELYVVGHGEYGSGQSAGVGSGNGVEIYAPALFPETVTCTAEEVAATSARLCGEINANGLPSRGFFEYGPPAGSRTSVAFEGGGTTFEPVRWPLTGLEPNETYGYRVLAEAEVAGEEAKGSGEELKFHTMTPAPVLAGEPFASFVGDQSVLLEAALNPEHATTHYHFEYRACNGLGECAAPQASAGEESSQYGAIDTTQEVRGLAPATTYRFRLVANNAHEEEREGKKVIEGGEATSAEGSFTTAPLPVPQAASGAANAVAATTATVSGTVDPDGQPATYAFELGVYAGGATQYGVVFFGPAGTGSVPVEETLGLTGLQPGTTYAYRVEIASGYGTATGAAALFTTAGLPEVLVSPISLPLLAVPSIPFPPPTATVVVQPGVKTLTNAQKLTKALKACRQKPKGAKRAACDAKARKRYAPVKKQATKGATHKRK
jgi:NHL repeat